MIKLKKIAALTLAGVAAAGSLTFAFMPQACGAGTCGECWNTGRPGVVGKDRRGFDWCYPCD